MGRPTPLGEAFLRFHWPPETVWHRVFTVTTPWCPEEQGCECRGCIVRESVGSMTRHYCVVLAYLPATLDASLTLGSPLYTLLPRLHYLLSRYPSQSPCLLFPTLWSCRMVSLYMPFAAASTSQDVLRERLHVVLRCCSPDLPRNQSARDEEQMLTGWVTRTGGEQRG